MINILFEFTYNLHVLDWKEPLINLTPALRFAYFACFGRVLQTCQNSYILTLHTSSVHRLTRSHALLLVLFSVFPASIDREFPPRSYQIVGKSLVQAVIRVRR